MTDKILCGAFIVMWVVLIAGAILEHTNEPRKNEGPSQTYGGTTVVRKETQETKETKEKIEALEKQVKKMERKVRR